MNGPAPLPPEDAALFAKLAEWVVARRMEAPAVLFLETVRPLSFVGSQAMHFFQPFARAIFPEPDYERLARLSNSELARLGLTRGEIASAAVNGVAGY